MDGTWTEDGVRLGGDARQQFHHARGYGRCVGESALRLAPVEAAYLLYRGDIDTIDEEAFPAFVLRASGGDLFARFLVYKDLRERGFYLSPHDTDRDFRVFERGSDPGANEVAFRVRVVHERSSLPVDELSPGVLAMVDEEGEVGYVEIEAYEPDGSPPAIPPAGRPADLVDDRAIVWSPPPELYAEHFFGQPVAGRDAPPDGPLQLSLVEALYLAEDEVLDLDPEAVRDRGSRADDFERRATVYRRLRNRGTVPKTGFKFGATYRVYHGFEDVENVGHSDVLVRTFRGTDHIPPSTVSLGVRLAHGVGKRMVFARGSDTDTTDPSWVSLTRITP